MQIPSPQKIRRGLTLLEVMLAIAIFGLALVAIGELIRIGGVCAAAARDLTEAQRHCSNVMAEVSAGIIPPDPATDTPVEGAEEWLYSIESQPLEEQTGMLWVSVTVKQDPSLYIKPATFTLVRWMIDPAASESAASESSDSTSSSSSSSSSGSSAPSSGAAGSSPSAGGASGT